GASNRSWGPDRERTRALPRTSRRGAVAADDGAAGRWDDQIVERALDAGAIAVDRAQIHGLLAARDSEREAGRLTVRELDASREQRLADARGVVMRDADHVAGVRRGIEREHVLAAVMRDV